MMFLVTDNNPLLPIPTGTILTQPTRGYFIALPVADVTDSTATIETTFTYVGEYDGVSEETLQIKHVHTIGDYHYYSVPWKMLSKITTGPSEPTVQANLYFAPTGKTPGTYSSVSVAVEGITDLVAPYSNSYIHHPYHPDSLTKKYLIGFKEMNDDQYISRLQLGLRRPDLINEVAHESNDPVFEQVADVSTYQYFNDRTVSGDSNFTDVTTGVSFDLSIKENGYWDLNWGNGDPWDGVSDMYLLVNFADSTKININTIGVGTVTGPGRTNTSGGNDTTRPGEIVTVTSTPADGYVLGSVIIIDASNNIIPSTDVDQNTKTFTAPETGDVDVTVTFISDEPEQPYEGLSISLDKDYVLVFTDVADGKSWGGPVHQNRWSPFGKDEQDEAGLTYVTGSHGSLTWIRDSAIWTQMILNVSLTNGGRTGMVYSRSGGEVNPEVISSLAKEGVHSVYDRVFFSRITPQNSDPLANLPEGIGQDFCLQDIQFQFQRSTTITGFTGTLYEVDPTSPWGDPGTLVATCTWNNKSTGSSLEWAGPDTTSWEPADNLAGLLE